MFYLIVCAQAMDKGDWKTVALFASLALMGRPSPLETVWLKRMLAWAEAVLNTRQWAYAHEGD